MTVHFGLCPCVYLKLNCKAILKIPKTPYDYYYVIKSQVRIWAVLTHDRTPRILGTPGGRGWGLLHFNLCRWKQKKKKEKETTFLEINMADFRYKITNFPNCYNSTLR